MNLAFKKIGKKEFSELLKKRDLENPEIIKSVEEFLIKKRGYVVKMPPPKSPVILLVSGGIDSITTWWLLLQKYKLNVYPLFLARGGARAAKERESVKFFSLLFRKRYKNIYHEPQEYSVSIPPPELSSLIKNSKTYFHPERVFEQFDTKTNNSTLMSGDVVGAYLYLYYGLLYAKQLYQSKNLKIKTTFAAVTPADGEYTTSQTLTALRTTMLSFCVITNDYQRQCMSLIFDSALGHWIGKSELIKLAKKGHIPLEKTWTCGNAGKLQCGECALCKLRIEAFKEAGIKDKTKYKSKSGIIKLYERARGKLNKILDKAF